MPAKVGAPKGNLNALKNGRRSAQLRFVLGELPKPMVRVTRNVRQYRRHIETATSDVHGSISDTHAHFIDEAASCEQTIGVSRWLLVHNFSAFDATSQTVLSSTPLVIGSLSLQELPGASPNPSYVGTVDGATQISGGRIAHRQGTISAFENQVVYTFDTPIHAFGFDVNPHPNHIGQPINLATDSAGSTSFNLPASDVTGFRGFLFDAPFSAVTFSTPVAQLPWGADNLAAVTPPPNTIHIQHDGTISTLFFADPGIQYFSEILLADSSSLPNFDANFQLSKGLEISFSAPPGQIFVITPPEFPNTSNDEATFVIDVQSSNSLAAPVFNGTLDDIEFSDLSGAAATVGSFEYFQGNDSFVAVAHATLSGPISFTGVTASGTAPPENNLVLDDAPLLGVIRARAFGNIDSGTVSDPGQWVQLVPFGAYTWASSTDGFWNGDNWDFPSPPTGNLVDVTFGGKLLRGVCGIVMVQYAHGALNVGFFSSTGE